MLTAVALVCLCVGFGHGSGDYQGDLPMENPELFGGDMAGIDYEDRNAVPEKRQLWPGGVVPFVLDESVTHGPGKTVFGFIVMMAFDMYHKNTCVRFVNRTTEQDYIRIYPGEGCWSYVGRKGGEQPVSLGQGCGWPGTVAHELGHAIGFYHEQNRSDRDDHITIHWENVKEGLADQFLLLKPEQNQLLTAFDYDSLMLYGSYTFSKDKSKRLMTMTGKDGRWLADVVSKGKLSKSDIKRVNMLYNCKI